MAGSMRSRRDQVNFAAVKAGVFIAPFAEGLYLVPEFADGIGDVFGVAWLTQVKILMSSE